MGQKNTQETALCHSLIPVFLLNVLVSFIGSVQNSAVLRRGDGGTQEKLVYSVFTEAETGLNTSKTLPRHSGTVAQAWNSST